MIGIRKVTPDIFIIKVVEVVWQSWTEGGDRWIRTKANELKEQQQLLVAKLSPDLKLIQNYTANIVWFSKWVHVFKKYFRSLSQWISTRKVGKSGCTVVSMQNRVYSCYYLLITVLFSTWTTVNLLLSIPALNISYAAVVPVHWKGAHLCWKS